jgi:ATP-dependent Zn protease
MYAIIIIFMASIYYFDNNQVNQEVSFSKFEEYVNNGGIKKLVVYTDKKEIEAVLNDSLASAIYKNGYTKGAGVEAKISTNFSTTDRIDQKIDAWRANGAFNGEVKYDRSPLARLSF